MIYLLSAIPSALMLMAVVVFVAVGARDDRPGAPSALLPSLGGILLLGGAGVFWFLLGAKYAGGIA